MRHRNTEVPTNQAAGSFRSAHRSLLTDLVRLHGRRPFAHKLEVFVN